MKNSNKKIAKSEMILIKRDNKYQDEGVIERHLNNFKGRLRKP